MLNLWGCWQSHQTFQYYGSQIQNSNQFQKSFFKIFIILLMKVLDPIQEYKQRKKRFQAQTNKRLLQFRKIKVFQIQRTKAYDEQMFKKDSILEMIYSNQEQEIIAHFDLQSDLQLGFLVLTQSSIRVLILTEIIRQKLANVLQFVNSKLGKQSQVCQSLTFYWRDETNNIIWNLMKTVIQLVNNQEYQYLEILYKEFTKQNSLFSLIFSRCDVFPTFQKQLAQTKNTIMLCEYILDIMKFYDRKDQIKEFNIKLNALKGDFGWQLNIFSPQNDQEIYILRELNYNHLHLLANTQDFQQFMNCIICCPATLINSPNMAGQTPIDVALRRFNSDQIQQLLAYASLNWNVKFTASCLNKLLSNKKVFSSPTNLLKLIKQLKEILSKREKELQAKKILNAKDSYGEYPLLKYLRNNKSASKQIVEQLLFEQLKLGIVNLQNRVVERVALQRLELISGISIFKKTTKLLHQKLKVDIKHAQNTLFQQLLFSALKCNEQIFKMILNYLIGDKQSQYQRACYLFVSDAGKTRDFGSNLLVVLIREGIMDDVVEEVIHGLFHKTKVQLKQFAFNNNVENKDANDQLLGMNVNIINQLLYEFYRINSRKKYIHLLKDQLSVYYRKNPKEILDFVIRNRQKVYVITLMDYIFDTQQLTGLLRSIPQNSFTDYVLDAIIESDPQLIECLFQSIHRKALESHVSRIVQMKDHFYRINYLVKLFITSFENNNESLPYYIKSISHLNIKHKIIKILFDRLQLQAINHLQTLGQFQYPIVYFAVQNPTKYPYYFIEKIISSRKSNIFTFKDEIQIPIIELRSIQSFETMPALYAKIGFDCKLTLPLRFIYNQPIQDSSLSEFLKDVFHKVLCQNKTYLQAIIASNDKYIDRVRPFFANDMRLWRFSKMEKKAASKYLCGYHHRHGAINQQAPFAIENEQNYLIMKELECKLLEQKDFDSQSRQCKSQKIENIMMQQ